MMRVSGGAKGTRIPDPLPAKIVSAAVRPAPPQVSATAGLSVSGREPPLITLRSGTRRAQVCRWCAFPRWASALMRPADHPGAGVPPPEGI